MKKQKLIIEIEILENDISSKKNIEEIIGDLVMELDFFHYKTESDKKLNETKFYLEKIKE